MTGGGFNSSGQEKENEAFSESAGKAGGFDFLESILGGLRAVGVLVTTIDEPHRIVYANRFWLEANKVTAGEAIGRLAKDVAMIPRNDIGFIIGALERVRNGEGPLFLDVSMTSRNGEKHWGMMEISLLEHPANGEKYFLLCTTEITKRRRTEEALQKVMEELEGANKLKDQFVEIVSHDLRSPLSSLHGALDLLRSRLKGSIPEDMLSLLDKAAISCLSLLKLIEKLLDINRLKTGKIKPNKMFVSAGDIVGKAIGRLHHLADEKGITIKNLAPSGWRIFVDEYLFAQVIQNLVDNAIKFCREGDTVTIKFIPGSPNTLAVKDTGTGIPAETIEHLFTPEVFTSTFGTKGEKGAGLGLPLCYNIMKAHGGTLRVESTPGEGSIFYCDIPAAKAIVLVADDLPVAREDVKDYMQGMNVEVVETENGNEAYEKALEILPHLIITDIKMPVMDGLELLDRLQSEPATKSIPVIVMTSMEDTIELRNEVFRRGASDFVYKPLVEKDFLPRVKRFISD